MNSLIIPAAGKSSRFPNMKPKWMLTHPDGQLMIEKALSSFNFDSFDNIIITILKEQCDKYEADVVLRQIYGDKIKLCILEQPTTSSAQTIVETINRFNLKDFIIVKDSDCFVDCVIPFNKQFIVGLKIDSNSEIDKIQNKSFIIKNDNDIVSDIVEKIIVSDTICVGIYAFKVENLLSAYEFICNNPIFKFKNELYLSHIISFLIMNKSETFEYIGASKFVDWGTIEEWKREQNKYKTFFIDIDGVLLYNTGKWGTNNWFNTFRPIEDNIKIIKKLSDSGNEIIFTTARSEKALEKFKQFMTDNDIKYKTIIYDCLHSKRIIINDFSNTNPFPSCEAVSIPRDASLIQYLKE